MFKMNSSDILKWGSVEKMRTTTILTVVDRSKWTQFEKKKSLLPTGLVAGLIAATTKVEPPETLGLQMRTL